MTSTLDFRLLAVAIASFGSATAAATDAPDPDWQAVAPGVAYQHVLRPGLDVHAVRVDLDDQCVQVIASAAEDRGQTVSGFAQRHGATVAINGDYFDEQLDPIGLAMGNGAVWARAGSSTRRQEVVGVGDRRIAIFPRAEPLREPAPWMTGAVSGWPMVIANCRPEPRLPGSEHFTRAPHPRTAVGLSGDARQLLLLVADGRREGVPGPTLPELADLMLELGACTAVNLDGGGSSALWIGDRIVNQPSDGFERAVGNHLGVVLDPDCECGPSPTVSNRLQENACRP